jgi:epoxyqueuosine reductase
MGGSPGLTTAGDAHALAERARAHAFAAGFDLAGVTTLGPAPTAPHLRAWLDRGFQGEMAWLERGADLRADTTRPEPGMRSAVVVALDYGGRQPAGPIARYARGNDYHDAMRESLRALHAALERDVGHAFAARPYVDTGPILERDLARRAGLGWFGKNTMLLNPSRGSWFFLGALFTSLDLAPDAPFESDHCGTCTQCLDACPTGALREPRVLDATRCISYLTIEHRTAIPEALRPLIGELVFGCDICQEVCPWNVKFGVEPRRGPIAPRGDNADGDLHALLALDDDAFRTRFRGTAVTRARRRGLLRNVAVALGNRGDPASVSALASALKGDPEPLVRSHAAWALGRVGRRSAGAAGAARDALVAARDGERDADVRAGIDAALGALD